MESDPARSPDSALARFGESIEDLDRVLGGEGDDAPDDDEVEYVCESCGESIVVPVDRSGGADQEYVEDCPVCCNANVIRLHLSDSGEATIEAHLE